MGGGDRCFPDGTVRQGLPREKEDGVGVLREGRALIEVFETDSAV